MTRMPQVTGRELVRFFKAQGFVEDRQSGSHLTLWSDEAKVSVTIPCTPGRTLAAGLPRAFLKTPGSAWKTICVSADTTDERLAVTDDRETPSGWQPAMRKEVVNHYGAAA